MRSIKGALRVEHWAETALGQTVGTIAACILGNVYDRLTKCRTGHQESMPECRAARGIPCDTVIPMTGIVEPTRSIENSFCRRWCLYPLFRKQILAIKHQFRCRLAWYAKRNALPVGGLPACGVKITWIKAGNVHDFWERADNAAFDKLAQPRQINRNEVIATFGALGVAKRLLMQAIDREDPLIDIGADKLFKLAFEVFHDHEGRITVHQNVQATMQFKRLGQHPWWGESCLPWLIRPAKVIVAGNV